MRDIKFRAWIKSGFDEDINPYMANVDRLDIVDKTIYADENYWKQKNYILMQYTGLKDKNGKEIYEGDRISYMGKIWEVRWVGAGFWLVIPEELSDVELTNNAVKFMEIIGNIYESKHLLDNIDTKE